jgi:hypothetical protein
MKILELTVVALAGSKSKRVYRKISHFRVSPARLKIAAPRDKLALRLSSDRA